MNSISEVLLRPRSLDRFARIVGPDRIRSLMETVARQRPGLMGRTIWTINSTAAGGGVAEMLRSLLAYAQALGIDARWLVISGNMPFFKLTKRLHNALHGSTGDGSALGEDERIVYDDVARANAAELAEMIGTDDIVILHDPQTAGLIPHLKKIGVPVIWRCHIGGPLDHREVRAGWSFLEPYLGQADALVFTRDVYVPSFCSPDKVFLVQPTIDPFSAKNQALSRDAVRAILHRSGLVSGNGGKGATFVRENGLPGEVRRQVDLRTDGPPPPDRTPLVVQVSRWDRLKDPLGVMNGFCGLVNGSVPGDAHLVLAGPSVAEVADDPEGRQVFEEVETAWRELPAERRRRVHLATIPMDDLEENAAIVNALQRHAAVVVQKSLQEGFGLTVTEAMWKTRPVVASAVGGIQDQIEDGVSGLLLQDPRDLGAFTAHLRRLLDDRALGDRIGQCARERVVGHFLGLTSLERYAGIIKAVLDGGDPTSA